MLTVLYTHLSRRLPPELWDAYFPLMPADIQARISRFTRWEDGHSTLLGRLLLIAGLSEYGYSQDCLNTISYDSYGRPFFDADIDFNISHSGRYVVCCITDRGRVGVDIEEIKPVNVDDFTDQMTSEQMDNIGRAENAGLQFFKYWTVKESVIKADGRALNIPLAEITVEGSTAKLFNKLWSVMAVGIDGDYECHVATETESDEICVKEFRALDF
jgi:4'-phosphopantetheinyl transferase